MEAEGNTRTFETGAVRDSADKKPMLQLISPHFLFELGEWLRYACKDRKPEPYPPRNWEKGMPFSETIGAMERHLQKEKLGSTTENHLAAVAFGCMALSHYKAEIRAGRMDPSIDDMPHYLSRPTLTPPGVSPEQLADLAITAVGTIPPVGEDNRQTFYITGPMRGIPLFNFPAFDEAQERGESLGYHIISPAAEDRKCGIDPTDTSKPMPELTPILVREIIQRDIDIIMGLNVKRGDGLALLPNWGASVGGGAEINLARWRGLKIVSAQNFRTMLPGEIQGQLDIWQKKMTDYLVYGVS